MISSDSRYQEADKQFAVAHSYDEYGRILLNGDDPTPVPRTVSRESLYRLTVPSPDTTVVEYTVLDGENLVYLSWKLTGQHASWWQIADANPNVWYPLDLQPGTTLKVPL